MKWSREARDGTQQIGTRPRPRPRHSVWTLQIAPNPKIGIAPSLSVDGRVRRGVPSVESGMRMAYDRSTDNANVRRALLFDTDRTAGPARSTTIDVRGAVRLVGARAVVRL